MLRIDRVLGSRLEPALSEELHRLEHRGTIDIVNVPTAEVWPACKKRLRSSGGGTPCAGSMHRVSDGANQTAGSSRGVAVPSRGRPGPSGT